MGLSIETCDIGFDEIRVPNMIRFDYYYLKWFCTYSSKEITSNRLLSDFLFFLCSLPLEFEVCWRCLGGPQGGQLCPFLFRGFLIFHGGSETPHSHVSCLYQLKRQQCQGDPEVNMRSHGTPAQCCSALDPML